MVIGLRREGRRGGAEGEGNMNEEKDETETATKKKTTNIKERKKGRKMDADELGYSETKE